MLKAQLDSMPLNNPNGDNPTCTAHNLEELVVTPMRSDGLKRC